MVVGVGAHATHTTGRGQSQLERCTRSARDAGDLRIAFIYTVIGDR